MAEASLLSKCAAEFVGTYLLVFTVGCNVLGGDSTWAGVSIACVLMVAIYALASVSGANFNPAVSVALGLLQTLGGGGMGWGTVAIYCTVQIVAGGAAAFSYRALFGKAFNLAPAQGSAGLVPAGVSEAMYTFMLCFVVLNVAASKGIGGGKNKFYGMAIGFVIIAGAYGAGHISGGCFNPAVAIGIDAASFNLGFGWCLPYTLFELAGACLAAGLFKVVRPEDFGGVRGQAARLVSEFIGTYMLVLTVGLNVCASSPAAALSIAASLTCMVYALGDVSGAHFNPAVTLAIKLTDTTFTMKDAFSYACAQIIGGVCAAATYAQIACTFAVGPAARHSWASAGVAEVVFTCLLCFVVLGVACSKTNNSEMFGFAIGSCVTVGGFAVGGISGGLLNPAVSIGLASASKLHGDGLFYPALVYMLYECLGGAIAAELFKVTHAAESKDNDYRLLQA